MYFPAFRPFSLNARSGDRHRLCGVFGCAGSLFQRERHFRTARPLLILVDVTTTEPGLAAEIYESEKDRDISFDMQTFSQ